MKERCVLFVYITGQSQNATPTSSMKAALSTFAIALELANMHALQAGGRINAKHDVSYDCAEREYHSHRADDADPVFAGCEEGWDALEGTQASRPSAMDRFGAFEKPGCDQWFHSRRPVHRPIATIPGRDPRFGEEGRRRLSPIRSSNTANWACS
jgi:hypothetical protein